MTIEFMFLGDSKCGLRRAQVSESVAIPVVKDSGPFLARTDPFDLRDEVRRIPCDELREFASRCCAGAGGNRVQATHDYGREARCLSRSAASLRIAE